MENVDADNTLVGESNTVTLANKASPHTISGSTKQNLKTKGLCQTELEVGSGTIRRTLNNDTVSQKAFALQDRVVFILIFISAQLINDLYFFILKLL